MSGPWKELTGQARLDFEAEIKRRAEEGRKITAKKEADAAAEKQKTKADKAAAKASGKASVKAAEKAEKLAEKDKAKAEKDKAKADKATERSRTKNERILAAVAKAEEKRLAEAVAEEKRKVDAAAKREAEGLAALRPKHEPASPLDEKTQWRVSASVKGKKATERFRWHRPSRSEALTLAAERIAAGDVDVVIRDPRSTEAWDVTARGGKGSGTGRLSLISRKTAKKPSRYQVWIIDTAGRQFLHAVYRKAEEAEGKAEWLRRNGTRVVVRPVYE